MVDERSNVRPTCQIEYNMKIYELIEMLQECNQEANVIATVDLSWKSDIKTIQINPQDIESRRTAKEIELVL